MADIKINHRYQEIELDDSWKDAYGNDYWNYRKLWNKVPLKQVKTAFPMHLDIEITNHCNLLCPMCPRTLMLERGETITPYYVDFKVFKTAIDQGKDKGLYAVNLNAAGETLFHPDIVKMVKYAKDNGILDIMFHTNATLLTENISKQLIDAGLDKLIVSFDSPIKEHYEKIRVGAKFDSVVKNVRRFAKLKEKNGKETPQLRINMVVMKENETEKKMMIDFWKGVANGIGFLGCINPMSMDQKDRSIKGEKFNHNFCCEKLWQRLTIGYKGEIKLCHMDEYNQIELGNIFKDKIENIWNGEQLEDIRNKHLSGNISKVTLCKMCGLPASKE